MSTSKKVIKNSGIYGIVSLLQKAIGFFMLPVYTHYLNPDAYGITAVVGSVVSFFSVFYMLSLNASITRFYYQYRDNEDDIKEFWGTNILFVMINSVVLSIILIIFRNYLLMPMAKGVSFYPYIFLGLVSITLNPIYSIFQSTLQAEQNGKKYGLNNITYFFVNLALTLLFIIYFKLGAKGVLLAASLTDIIFFAYTLINFIPRVKLTIKWKYLKESLKYSLPLIPHSLAGWTMAMIDKLFLNGMKSTSLVGIYNIGYQFGNLMNLLTTAVNQAFVPWFFEKMGEKEKGKGEIIKFSEYAIVFYGFVAMVISLFGEDVINIMVSKNFKQGWLVVPFISFAYVFNGIYYFFANPLFYNTKGTKYIPIGTFSGAFLNAILNVILIPKLGIIGSSVASIISMFVSSLLILFISNRIEKIQFNVVKIYSITIIFFIVSTFSFANVFISNRLIFTLIKIIILIIVSMLIKKIYSREVSMMSLKIRSFIVNKFQ